MGVGAWGGGGAHEKLKREGRGESKKKQKSCEGRRRAKKKIWKGMNE